MITDINSEDRLVQRTFAAWTEETFGPNGTLGRGSEREVVLVRDLRAALELAQVIDFRNPTSATPASYSERRGQSTHRPGCPRSVGG